MRIAPCELRRREAHGLQQLMRPRHRFGTAESVDVHSALRSYTAANARLLFLEDRIGTLEVGKDADIAVCSNPEFLREGSAIQDFMHPDRVLVGCDDPRAREMMFRLYKPLTLRNTPVIFVGRESAELVASQRSHCAAPEKRW